MSWTLSYEYENGDITDDTHGAVEEFVSNVEKPESKVEVAEQALVAVAYADAIIRTGFVGEESGKFKIVLSGHANDGHKPAAGWANDALTINIYQI